MSTRALGSRGGRGLVGLHQSLQRACLCRLLLGFYAEFSPFLWISSLFASKMGDFGCQSAKEMRMVEESIFELTHSSVCILTFSTHKVEKVKTEIPLK